MVEERCHPPLHAHNERPPDVRRSKTDLRARVNGDLPLEFTDIALTSYAGLELFGRYLRATRLNAVVRDAWAGAPSWGDFGAVAMVRVLIGLLVVGGRPRPGGRRASAPSPRRRSLPTPPSWHTPCGPSH